MTHAELLGRERSTKAHGFTLWFTGLSGAGKSTLAAAVRAELGRRGIPVEVLDGDEVRQNLSKGLGFSREDRDTKGLYARALAKEIPQFTGVSDPYEEPLSPELVIDTEREEVSESAARVIDRLLELGHLRSPDDA